MKRLLLAILLLCAYASATTTVTGTVGTLGGGVVTSGTFVRFWLRGCGGNQPRIGGTALIAPTQGGVFYFDLPVNGSGAVSGTLYSTRDGAGTGNGDIECGGSKTSVWYGMQAFTGGKGGPEVAVHAKSGAVLNISTVTPITSNPVIVAPTGDNTYCRLDAGNGPCGSAGNVNTGTNNNFTAVNTFSNAGTFTSGPNLYLKSLLNGCDPSTQFNAYNLSTAFTEASTWCVLVPASANQTQANAVGAYVENQTGGSGPGSDPSVALYGQARATVNNGGHVWGINAVALDSPGVTTGNAYPAEFDFKALNAGTAPHGILINGLFSAQTANGIAFDVATTQQGVCTVCTWDYGLRFEVGTTLAPALGKGAIYLNPLAAGVNKDSQGIAFISNDPVSGNNVVGLSEAAGGDLQIKNTVTGKGLLVPNVNPGGIGPSTVNNRCQVDGITHANIAACMGLQGGTTGYRSQAVESSIPEVISVNPAPSNYSVELYLGPGIKSLNCDSVNPNCWVLEAPLILTSGSTIKGTGTVTVGNAGPGDMSGGTVIATGVWFPPLGVPTVSAPTCGVAGGSLTNGNYFVTIRTANNLQTNGGTAVAGPSMHTTEFTVNCANGGAAQSISVTSPSAVGNAPFNAKDYQVAASTTTGQEQIQARDTTNMACTAGIVSTFNGVNYGCLMGATATIKTIQTATRFFQDTDHSNDAIIIVPNQTVGFGVQMYGFTFSCGPINSANSFNMPNWAIWNQAGEELTGLTPSGLNLTAGCGGYSTGTPATGGSATGFSGGYIYQDTHTPNSVLEHMALGGGATTASVTAPFYSIYLDGRFDSSGSAAGVPRTVNDITVTPKSGNDVGHTPAYSLAAIYVTGARAKVHFSNIHIETTVPTTGDGIQCDNGAYCLFDGIEGQNATVGILIHCTATAGFCGGYGLCAIGTANSGQNKCAGQGQTGAAATFKDDSAGGQKLLGFVGHFSSIVANFKFVGLAPMTFTNLSTIYPCAAGTEGYEGSVTDDNTALAFDATITGGGTNHVHAFCNGTNWVMQ